MAFELDFKMTDTVGSRKVISGTENLENTGREKSARCVLETKVNLVGMGTTCAVR